MEAQPVVAKVSVLEGPSKRTPQSCKEGGALVSDEKTGTGSSTAQQAQVTQSSPREISPESSSSGISSTSYVEPPEAKLTLADLHGRLTPENKKLWYRRTGGAGGAEGIRVAVEILKTQGAA